jgi:hypothetical protein
MRNKLDLPTIYILLVILALALGLAWVSSSFTNIEGFLPFTYVLSLGILILWLGWRLIRPENPGKWLLYLVIGAAVLRLAAGVFWFIELPIFGYPNETQQSGYIMYDAYRRENAAWELAQSEEPLLSAFQGASYMDQYGGVLFVSGFVYRYLAEDVHYPLQIVAITAAFSAAAVWFTWATAKQLWGEKAAKAAAWLLALYPEAVLLGSSQMREAYTITLVTAFSYYLIKYWKTLERKQLYGVGAVLAISLATSFPVVIMQLFIALAISISMYSWKTSTRNRRLITLGAVGAFVGFLVVISMISREWWGLVIDYQSYTTVAASGKLDAVLGRIPEWLHYPYLVGYGIVRPLLPAALVAYDSGWLWYSIAIWRAVGWTALFGLFLYANLLAFKEKSWRSIVGALLTIVWIGILFASIRGGGDLWDNPRYRVIVAGLQACAAAWGLWRQQETKDPWLRRVVVTVGMLIAWFLAWYIDRKVVDYGWPVTNMISLIVLAFLSSVGYILWDRKRLSRQTNNNE